MSKLWSWLVPDDAKRLLPRCYLALALITLALHLPGQIGIPVMDRDEARYAQATRQMLASGDFVDIKFADQDRYLQPIGIYWIQSAFALPFGGAKAPIWAFRLPSLLAALASVLLTAWFGARLFGATVGLSAGLILAPSLLLSLEAHFAKIDSVLLLVILIAQVSLYLTIARESGEAKRFIGWPLIFWLAMGIGGLLKGPIILLIVGLTVVAYGLWQRQWRFLWRDLKPVFGLMIVAAIVAPWLIAINVKTNGEFFRHAIGHSFGYKIAHGEQSHGQPPGYHTLLFVLTFFPGIALAGLGASYAWKNRSARIVRFLLCWILTTWIMFEAVATKLPHYVLPVFPALALLASLGLRDGCAILAGHWRWAHRLAGLMFLIGAIAIAALPVVASLELENRVLAAAFASSVLALSLLAAGAFLWWRPQPQRLLPVGAAAALTYFCMLQILIPAFDRLWVSDRVGRIAARLEGCARMSVATAGYSEPSAVFHFGATTFLGDGKSAARYLADHPGCGIAIVESREKAAFEAELASEGVKAQRFGGEAGINYVNGDAIELEIYGTNSSALELVSPAQRR